MGYTFNIFNVFILIGAIQGLILSFLFFISKKGIKRANRFLGVLMLAFSLFLLNQVGYESGLYNDLSFLHVVPFSYVFLIGPSLYFYSLSLIYRSFNLKWYHYLQFLPCFYLIFYLGFYYAFLQGISDEFKWIFFDSIDLTERVLGSLSMFIYIWLTIRMIRKYRNWASSNYSSSQDNNLRWLHALIIFVAGAAFVWFGYSMSDQFIFDRELQVHNYYPMYITMSVALYWLGISGFLKLESIGNTLDVSNELILKDFNQHEKQRIQPDVCATYLQKLRAVISEERLYLQPTLSLNELADRVGINSKVVSQVINQGAEKNFNDFVNEYRIEEVKRRILDPSFRHLTILGIAFESGFNSKTSFNRTFKEFTGFTPKEYKVKMSKG